nr:hypothetical protein [uncultured Acetatifactor sp.]
MESGETGWRKLTGDILFQRMGILPDYFEMVASGDEMERWRLREDICLLVPDRVGEAKERIMQYRRKYPKREALEEQFLCKVELFLLWKDREAKEGTGELLAGEELLSMAEAAVSCTVPDGWLNERRTLLLAPSELEAILLVGAGQFACGRMEEAWEVQSFVWNYPEKRQWKKRMAVQIKPQAALLGMELALREEDSRKAFEFAREALELLRGNACHCYLLPLLEQMGRISGEGFSEGDWLYLRGADEFRDIFKRIYHMSGYPENRVWQGISVENTREAGITLKMLRKFAGKPLDKAVFDDDGIIVTRRQLEKIESGAHKPSYTNYQRLVHRYGKHGGWMIPMLETDSIEVLELRQEISSQIGFCQWDKVEAGMERLRQKVDIAYPRVRQELLFFEAIILLERKGELEKSLELLQKALHVTVPEWEGKDAKWWVFQREEIIIASNILDIYREMGKLAEAKEWCEAICFSMEQQKDRTNIMHTGYAILMEVLDNYLGELRLYEEAIDVSKKAVSNYLKQPRIGTLGRAYYRIAWNTYEAASGSAQQDKRLQKQWREAFQASEGIAAFVRDNYLMRHLKDKREKYLF